MRFIHEQDPAILEDALKSKVVFCSPVTLFAVLAVIRQAIDNFALERTSHEILSLLGLFREQWSKFVEQMDRLGKRIEDVQKDYDSLAGTRRKQLERPLAKIEELKAGGGADTMAGKDIDIADEVKDSNSGE